MRSRANQDEVGTPTQTAFGSPTTHVQTGPTHDFYLQSAMHTERSIGALEQAVKTLTETTSKHGEKLDKVVTDIEQAKGSMKTFRWVFGIAIPAGTVILEALAKHFHLL